MYTNATSSFSLSTMLFLPICIFSTSVMATNDPGLKLDRIDRLVQVDLRETTDLESSTDATTEFWAGHAGISRLEQIHAEQCFNINTNGIEGTMMVDSNVRKSSAAAISTLEVDFTVERTDYSRPDASSAWSGQSPLESLFGSDPSFGLDQQPACEMYIHTHLRYERVFFTTDFPSVDNPFSESPYREGGMGYTLWCDGELLSWHLLEPRQTHGDAEQGLTLQLPPGEYTLKVQCGLQGKNRGRDDRVFGTASIDLLVDFTPVGPGSAQAATGQASRLFDLEAGSEVATWIEDPLSEEEWLFRQAHDSGDLANGGSVVDFQAGGWHGYLFARTQHDSDSASEEARSLNQLNSEFTLPIAATVGISTLSSFSNEIESVTSNQGQALVRISSRSTGSEVYRATFSASGVIPAGARSGFDTAEDWMALPPGTYDVRIQVSSASLLEQEMETGNEAGLWFAMIFDAP